MINVQPYIDKLDLLREYMHGFIDAPSPVLIRLESVAGGLSPEQLIRLWDETGHFYINTIEPMVEEARMLSFDEFLYYRQPIPYVSPAPESFDGGRLTRYVNDEAGCFPDHRLAINPWRNNPLRTIKKQ